MENNIIILDSKNLPLISEADKFDYVEGFVEYMGSGEKDELELYIQAKQMASMFNEIVNHPKVKQFVDAKFSNDKEKHDICGFVIEKASRSTYDYKNDARWVELDKEIKEREKLLKAIPVSGMADPETGEMVYPPIKKPSEFFKLTNKNK